MNVAVVYYRIFARAHFNDFQILVGELGPWSRKARHHGQQLILVNDGSMLIKPLRVRRGSCDCARLHDFDLTKLLLVLDFNHPWRPFDLIELLLGNARFGALETSSLVIARVNVTVGRHRVCKDVGLVVIGGRKAVLFLNGFGVGILDSRAFLASKAGFNGVLDWLELLGPFRAHHGCALVAFALLHISS